MTAGRIIRALSWAIFLGMSWTWCIGMFLPVLLVRDYGPWAWLVFAIPNVVGAAAMGWTLSGERSAELVQAHRPAVVAFSLVTIAFQLFFATWFFSGAWPFLLGVVAIAIVCSSGAFSRPASLLAFIVSCGCITELLLRSVKLNQTFVALPIAQLSSGDLLGLASCCLFGFALCPYLDGTFHRARQRLDPSESKIAFGFGFGFFFLIMIVGTWIYARPLITATNSTAGGGDSLLWRILRVHWMTQLGFTIGSHLLVDRDSLRGRGIEMLQLAGGAVAVAAAGYALSLLASPEVVYRCFMGFYGLVFPAYVWLCILPGRGKIKPARRNWIVFVAAVICAMPWLAMAFLAHRMVDATLGVAVVLVARLLIRKEVQINSSVQQNSAPTS